MECDMEIEDESPEASGMEEATPPREPPAISVAPPIPVPPVIDDDKGQTVEQALPPTSREGESKVEDDDEPLPPGVEEDEPLPPGIEAASGSQVLPSSITTAGGNGEVLGKEPGKNDQSVAQEPCKCVHNNMKG